MRKGYITKSDGQEIFFGGGTEVKGGKLGWGPDPELCNLHLAVGRILEISGAADLVNLINKDAEDDYPFASNFANVLSAKLILASNSIPVR